LGGIVSSIFRIARRILHYESQMAQSSADLFATSNVLPYSETEIVSI